VQINHVDADFQKALSRQYGLPARCVNLVQIFGIVILINSTSSISREYALHVTAVLTTHLKQRVGDLAE
jgi:hypothetical protein